MKKCLIFLIFITTLACNSTKVNCPEIIIDDKHYNLKIENKKSIPCENYFIESTKSIIVDPTKYDFSKVRELNNGADPDLIQILSRNGTFVADLNPSNKIILDSTTLRNIGGKEKFKGFEKGDTAIIGLGTLDITQTVEFKTFWVTMIIVK